MPKKFSNIIFMLTIITEAGAVGAGAASSYGSGAIKMMRLLGALALQH
jgi:hypothetical protein